MPFPFRNPVNTSYDDGDDQTTGKPPDLDENLQPISASKPPDVDNIGKPLPPDAAPTKGTAKGGGQTPNPNDDWWKGFDESLFGGEATKTGAMGGLGWLKGAILDLPGNIVSGAKTIGDLITPGTSLSTAKNIGENMMHLPEDIMEKGEKSGSDPMAFGEVLGQNFGQPAVVGAAPDMIPAALPSAGRGLQSVGRFIAKNQPITGMAPPFAVPRTLRLLERGAGHGIDYAGRGLESLGENLNKGDLLAKANDVGMNLPNEPLLNLGTDIDLKTPIGKPGGVVDKLGEGISGDKTPPEKVAQLQKKATAIQSNVDKKYGGDTSKASASTQDTLNKTKAAIPVLNRPGTYITVRQPTPDMILKAQQLGYQVESKDALGNVRMKQTGKPITINQAPTNTDIGNIDLNTPMMGSGGQ